jgi:hypothetical protein
MLKEAHAEADRHEAVPALSRGDPRRCDEVPAVHVGDRADLRFAAALPSRYLVESARRLDLPSPYLA